MKHLMWGWGVDPLVIPNGLAAEALVPPERHAVEAFRAQVPRRTVVSKVARWHPDKRWLFAIDTVGAMQQVSWRPLLIARGGVEAHGQEVLATAAAAGLRVVERPLLQPGARGLLQTLEGLEAEKILQAGHVAKTPYEAMGAALKSVQHKLCACRALEGVAAVPHRSNRASLVQRPPRIAERDCQVVSES